MKCAPRVRSLRPTAAVDAVSVIRVEDQFAVLASLSAPPTCARKTDEAKKSESTWSRNHRIQRCVVQDGPDPAVGRVDTVDHESPAANKLREIAVRDGVGRRKRIPRSLVIPLLLRSS